MERLIQCALGQIKADVVLKNAYVVDVFNGEIACGDVAIINGRIAGIGEYDGVENIDCSGMYVAPSYIDGHMHIESTMLSPSELAKAIIPCGTTDLIADPHEIANVCGMNGVNFFIEEGKNTPLNIHMMMPSCVPATPYENSGAILNGNDVEVAMARNDIFGLGEFMNYPGILSLDKDCLKKIQAAKNAGKMIDGHAPNLSGKQLNAYACTGIKTDHECMTHEEMKEKVALGMYVHLREGSATRNVKQNCGFINEKNMRRVILCTDDRHSSDIKVRGHLDCNMRLLVEEGVNPIWAITMGTLNTAECYGLKDKGAVAPGYIADLVVLNNLVEFKAQYVFKDGKMVAKNGVALFDTQSNIPENVLSTVHIKPLKESDFDLYSKTENVKVIRLLHNNVVTEKVIRSVKINNGVVDIKGTDMLKLAVVERHKATGNIGLGLIEGYGLKNGAIALTVSHDSHNIIVLGDNNQDMLACVRELEKLGGGMTIASGGKVLKSLPLKIAGLMTDENMQAFNDKLQEIIDIAYNMGVSTDIQPFMSLSFLALVVIPELKITDRGLFDVTQFNFTGIEE